MIILGFAGEKREREPHGGWFDADEIDEPDKDLVLQAADALAMRGDLVSRPDGEVMYRATAQGISRAKELTGQ